MYIAWKPPCPPPTYTNIRSRFCFTYALAALMCAVIIVRYLTSASPPPTSQLSSVLAAISTQSARHRYNLPGSLVYPCKCKALLTTLLMLCGDIQSNPGPAGNAHIYPCGLCELPVTWGQDGLCCDGCDVWHHRSCIELCSVDSELLAKHSHVQWLRCRCDSINIMSFTFHSFELTTSNSFNPLSYLDTSIVPTIDVIQPIPCQ